ncbi:MAG TPA: hypothetical protein VF666_19315 [Pyrinomonadaceae bacterium]|jgi:hypothetical protein
MLKSLRISVVVLVLACSVYADGDIQNGVTDPPPPPPTNISQPIDGNIPNDVDGEMPNGQTVQSVMVEIMMNILGSMLSLF